MSDQLQQAPEPKKKTSFSPTTTTMENYDGKRPLSFRPQGAQIPFVFNLIKEKGTQQLALAHCVDVAMSKPGQPIIKEVPKVITKEVPKEVIKEVVKEVKVPAQLTLTDQAKAALETIKAKMKCSMDEAISYALVYTKKNDWL